MASLNHFQVILCGWVLAKIVKFEEFTNKTTFGQNVLQRVVLVEDVLSPSFSFLPYSCFACDSNVTPVQMSWKIARLACHKWPKKKEKAKAMCENEYQPRADVLNTPSVNLDVFYQM